MRGGHIPISYRIPGRHRRDRPCTSLGKELLGGSDVTRKCRPRRSDVAVNEVAQYNLVGEGILMCGVEKGMGLHCYGDGLSYLGKSDEGSLIKFHGSVK